MKIAALATVKDQFSAYVQESQTSPVIITMNGKPVALFTGIRDEDDLDSLLLTNNPRFLQILEEARQRTRQTGGVKNKISGRTQSAATNRLLPRNHDRRSRSNAERSAS
jgi:antitoxin (DNA-binding transcriptional repressor) of toxin-antitoxin stability system